MKVLGIVFAYVVGANLVVRAIIELVTIDYGDAASYEKDLAVSVVRMNDSGPSRCGPSNSAQLVPTM
jgi:hypothetical protein